MFAERREFGPDNGSYVEQLETTNSTRFLIRCNVDSVDQAYVTELLEKELGKKVRLIRYELEPGEFKEKIVLPGSTTFIPISFVRAWYE